MGSWILIRAYTAFCINCLFVTNFDEKCWNPLIWFHWCTDLSDSNPYSGVELRPWTFQWVLTLYLLIWTDHLPHGRYTQLQKKVYTLRFSGWVLKTYISKWDLVQLRLHFEYSMENKVYTFFWSRVYNVKSHWTVQGLNFTPEYSLESLISISWSLQGKITFYLKQDERRLWKEVFVVDQWNM